MLLLFFITLLFSCNSTRELSSQAIPVSFDLQEEPPYVFPFDLKNPDKTLLLDDKLKEISGLSYLPNEKMFAAVQDEKGVVYFLSKKNGKIKEKIKFRKEGDYEGVEVLGESIFVIKSTGTVYEFANSGKDKPSVETYNHFLQKENNVEGLGYDPSRNQLLLACKGVAKGCDSEYVKAIFPFHLDTKTIGPNPLFLLSLENFQDYIQNTPKSKNLENLKEWLNENESCFSFGPSAIAVHPKDGNIFILSSMGKLLVVLNSSGKILHMEKLKKKVHRQPEGICFGKDGSLYISNEGEKKKAANIYRFKPLK